MIDVAKITPAIGAELSGVNFSEPVPQDVHEAIYDALLENLVIFFRGTDISPAMHLEFAAGFGELDAPHPLYPHVEGFDRIVLLENDSGAPPDTNSWHTDLTFKSEQPFSSILVARHIPPVGGDTMWSSCYAAYDRLSDGMKRDLSELDAVHDYGDFRNSFADAKNGTSGVDRLNESVARFGHGFTQDDTKALLGDVVPGLGDILDIKNAVLADQLLNPRDLYAAASQIEHLTKTLNNPSQRGQALNAVRTALDPNTPWTESPLYRYRMEILRVVGKKYLDSELPGGGVSSSALLSKCWILGNKPWARSSRVWLVSSLKPGGLCPAGKNHTRRHLEIGYQQYHCRQRESRSPLCVRQGHR